VNLAERQMVLGIGDSELNAAIDVLRRINRNLAHAVNDSTRPDSLQEEEAAS